jgi:hypothetical protein
MKRYQLRSPDGSDSTEFLEGFEDRVEDLLRRGWVLVEDTPALEPERPARKVKDAADERPTN